MKWGLLITVAVSLFTACNNQKGADKETNPTPTEINNPSTTSTTWDSSNRTAFLTRCIDGSKGQMGDQKARAYCTCMLEKIEAKYPIADSAAALNMNEMQDMARECVK